MNNYVIGLDYGTDSVRALLVNADTGQEVDSHVHYYRRWKEGKFCDPGKNQFRQHILDHIEGLEATISNVVKNAGLSPEEVKAICVDTTGSSPIPVKKDGSALCLTPRFEDNPNAMMILWKDHTAIVEAEEINDLARNWGGEDFTKYEGGIYSSEWFWAKILHIIREDDEVKSQAFSWVEHCDLMTNILIGNQDIITLKRSRCAAGHKAMWHEDWNGLPPKEFLSQLDPHLATLRDQLYEETYTSDQAAGYLSAKWAEKLGLTTDTVIAVGTFDAHAGAVGVGAEKKALVRVMGTSTCDMIVVSENILQKNTVKGICGQVDGSIIPGMIGLEAGQSAFGDALAWYKSIVMWPTVNVLPQLDFLSAEQREKVSAEMDEKILAQLSNQASEIPLSESVPIALDWINGRRTPDANQTLKSAIAGLSLGTSAAHIFKALVHAICFGSKKIVDRFESEGVEIDKVIGIGGVARKSAYIMQTLADVLNRPIVIAASDQAPALGAAIYASLAAGIYPDVVSAAEKLGSPFEAEYFPTPEAAAFFSEHMKDYEELAKFMERYKK